VSWGGIIVKMSLSQRVLKIVGDRVDFLIGEKMISSDFDGSHDPGCRHLALGFKPGR